MASTLGHCRACGELRKLVEAHIIPESFCKQFVRNGAPAKLVAPNEYVKRSHIGVYDKTILCKECEGKLSLPDDYGQDLLLKKARSFEPISINGEVVALQALAYDYELLHRFILAVLWRASVSSQAFFRNVDLGPHEQRVREIVFGGKTANGDYPFWAGRLIHHTENNMMPAPIRKKIEGVNYWGVYIGDFHFWVKVDSFRSTPAPFVEAQATPQSPLTIICRQLIGSPEHRGAKATAKLRKMGKV